MVSCPHKTHLEQGLQLFKPTGKKTDMPVCRGVLHSRTMSEAAWEASGPLLCQHTGSAEGPEGQIEVLWSPWWHLENYAP